MSRAERRQFQRTVRGGGPLGPQAVGPQRPRRRDPRRPTPERPARPTDLSFGRRFWTWTILGAAAAGLLLLSLSWVPQAPDHTPSLLAGALGAALWVAGAVGARLIRRRLAAR